MEKILKVDLDSRFLIIPFILRFRKIKRTFQVNAVSLFETKKGFHVYIYMKKRISFLKALLLQVYLFSDLFREITNLNMKRNRLFSLKVVCRYQHNEAKIIEVSKERKTLLTYIFEKILKVV
jgi:hypothetical protein